MFNLTIVGLIIGLIALIVASVFDIKTREVPDWLNYSLIGFAIGSALVLSIYHGYYHILVNSLLGLGVGIIIGLLMFYTGQWGGGDSKLIMGLSALIGFSISDFTYGIPLLIVFFVNILLVGAVYGMFFSFVKAILNFKNFRKVIEQKLRTKAFLIIRILFLIIGLGALIFFLITKTFGAAMIFIVVMALFLFFYLWIFVSTVEKTCMIKKVKVKDLTEGDWIVGNVMKKKKIILKPNKIGVTLKQIALLKKHNIRNLTIKVGVPFVPSFLIAYILTFWLGNWLVYLL